MKETIGIELTRLASQFVNIYLAEAEEENYPYAVYTSDVTPVYTKDGIHHYEASVSLTVFDKDLDTCDQISDSIDSAILENMTRRPYISFKTSDSKDCGEGIWSRTMNFTIKQFS